MPIQRRIGPRSGTVWVDLFGETSEYADEASAHLLRRWASGYLTEPNPDLGRSGPVCPFVRPSIGKQLFGAAFVHGSGIGAGALGTIVEDQFDLYTTLSREDDRDRSLKTLVTVLPDLTGFEVIDVVHTEFKSRFVEHGFMLGQFYPGCTQPGLWNHDFHPLDAPLPMLVARHMMTTDFPFLVGRQEWLCAYFKKFAPALPSTLRLTIAKRMKYDGDAVDAITAHHELTGNEPGR
ncbi:hypothetical protein M1C57_00485 [Rhodococcus pyridinivorans]|uniref:DUF6875 domain-containing protein n=1 Tax=Rhodococcus pyridinivorans TaxID=103816 RepID=UPI00200A4580|nr:hypothetical protein [Rhodococcus pyridinivorans]UPW04611.1 hypothetical protein M1C57_00485 [Rhodococcus pyridinivorans]